MVHLVTQNLIFCANIKIWVVIDFDDENPCSGLFEVHWACPGSPDLKLSNRPVRTRMPGGVAGVPLRMEAPYADVRG